MVFPPPSPLSFLFLKYVVTSGNSRDEKKKFVQQQQQQRGIFFFKKKMNEKNDDVSLSPKAFLTFHLLSFPSPQYENI